MPARRHRLTQRRKMVGFSQERLAEAVGVDRSTVVRWERAETEPQPWHRPRLAAALKISVEELANLLAHHSPQVTPVLPGDPPASGSAEPAAGADDLDVVRSFRTADRQVGGAHLYAAVTSYLQRTVAPRLFGHTPDRDGERVFAAAASLTEMAGWMAHDCGHDPLARQHFERASSMASAGRDHHLAAHIFGSLSHLADHVRRPERAIAYARQGQEQLALGGRNPGLEARLLALQARGHAAAGDAGACIKDLRRAERVLASKSAKPTSPWATNYDDASLAVETARCLYRIGDFSAANTQVEQVIALRPPERIRSRALAHLILVSILVAQNRPERACVVAQKALDSTRALGSVVVFRQFESLGQRLAPYRHSPEVNDFLRCLRNELSARRWMTLQLRVGIGRADGSL